MSQIKSRQPDYLRIKLDAYRILESAENYKTKAPLFKIKIKQQNIPCIIAMIGAIKNVLKYRHISCIQDILKAQNIAVTSEQALQKIELTQFSKLLSLRFLKEIYFQCEYLFMSLASVELGPLLLKIAQFKSQLTHQERGKHIFKQNHKVFEQLGRKNLFSFQNKSELQTIGFSIHKLTLQFLQIHQNVFSCYPFHEYFIQQNLAMQPFLINNLSNISISLKQKNVKFPSQIHYFKTNDAKKFREVYEKKLKQSNFDKIYQYFFTALQSKCQLFLNSKHFLQGNISYFLKQQNRMHNKNSDSIKQSDTLHQLINLASQSKDRYLWRCIYTYFKNKQQHFFQTFNEKDMLSQIQFKQIMNFTLFILYLAFHSGDIQIVLLFQTQFMDQYAHLYLILLTDYCRRRHIEQNVSLFKTEIKNIDLYGTIVLSYFRSFIQALFHLSQQTKQQVSSLQKKQNTIFPFVESVCKKILSISLKNEDRFMFVNNQNNSILRQISQKVSNHSRINSQKYKILSSDSHYQYYAKQNKEQRQQLGAKIQSVLWKQLQFLQQIQLKNNDFAQYIEIPVEEIQFKGNQSYVQNKMEFLNMMQLTSFILNTKHQKTDTQSMNSHFQKKLQKNTFSSFKQSLHISLSPPGEVFIRSLKKSNDKRREKSTTKAPSLKLQTSSKDSNTISVFQTPKRLTLDKNPFQKVQENPYLSQNTENPLDLQPHSEQTPAPIVQKNYDQKKIAPGSQIVKRVNQYKIRKSSACSEIKKSIIQVGSFKVFNLQSINQSRKRLNYFYFGSKMKKQLLRQRNLVLQNELIDLGIITQVYPNIKTSKNSKQTVELTANLFLTAKIQIKDIRLNIDSPSWLSSIAQNKFVTSLQKQEQANLKIVCKLELTDQKYGFDHNYGQFPLIKLNFSRESQNNQIDMVASLPILIHKFLIKMEVTEKDQANILRESQEIKFFGVHKQLAVNLQGINKFYSNIKISKLQKNNQLSHEIFWKRLGIVKLGLPNIIQIFLVFCQRQKSSDYSQIQLQAAILYDQQNIDIASGLLLGIKKCLKSILKQSN